MVKKIALAAPVALLTLVLTLALAGCMPKVGAAPGPLANETLEIAKAKWTDATPEALEQGRQLFLKHCNQCHGYPDLVAFPEAKWPATAKRMATKEKLSDADGELVARFVVALRAELTAPPKPAAEPKPAEPAPAPAATP